MNMIRAMDDIARFYPIIDDANINGVTTKR